LSGPTFTPPPIQGYRELTQSEVDAMNELKELEARVLEVTRRMRMAPSPQFDQRAVSIGITNVETGFWWLVRAIARPNPS